MKRNKIATKIESPFNIDEMFFSITDKKGIILAGNKVFARVSKIDLKDMIGEPHNIIRHPDMPKAIFQLLWSEISEGKPLTAYVKNMASDGSYYWVIATVFPLDDKYISIRIKPTSDTLVAVDELYQKMRLHENSTDNDSTPILTDFLKTSNFSSYTNFMSKALSSEVFSMFEKMSDKKEVLNSSWIKDCTVSQEKSKRTSVSIQKIMSSSSDMNKGVSDLLYSFAALKNTVLNLTISSYHVGEKAASMAVISEIFNTQASEVAKLLGGFQSMLTSASTDRFAPLEYKLLSVTLQISMIKFFLSEIYQSTGSLENLPEDIAASCVDLSILASQSLKDVSVAMEEISDELRLFKTKQLEFSSLVDALRVLYQMGKIELAKVPEGAKSFSAHLQDMNVFIQKAYPSILTISEKLDYIQSEIRNSQMDIRQIITSCKAFSNDLKAKYKIQLIDQAS